MNFSIDIDLRSYELKVGDIIVDDDNNKFEIHTDGYFYNMQTLEIVPGINIFDIW